MAASMCDVFSFCVGVAGRARVAVEVRFVSSAKVRPRRTRREPPTLSGLGNSPTGSQARSLEAPLPLGLCGSVPARGPEAPCLSPRAGFRGGHAMDRGLRSLRARAPFPRYPARQPGALLPLPQAGPGRGRGAGVGGEGGGAGLFGPGCGTLLLGSRYGGLEYAEQRELRYKKAWVLRELPE